MSASPARLASTVLALTLVGGAAVAPAHPAAAEETETAVLHLPKAALSTAFNLALSSTSIQLDNFGAKHGTSWHEDDSWVLLPGGSKFRFGIPENTFKVTKRRSLLSYVDKLHSSSMTAKVDGDRVVVEVAFESADEEIKTRCVRDPLIGKKRECSLKMERDAHLDNMFVAISVSPAAHDGSVSYADPDVEVAVDVRISNKLCQAFKRICDKIEDKIHNALVPRVEDAVREQLESGAVRDTVAAALRAPLAPYVDPAWRVTDVSSQGSEFLVTVERPVTIDGDTVAGLTLQTVSSPVIGPCPAKVKLRATVATLHAVSGTGFLTNSSGVRSPEFAWGTGPGAQVTSSPVSLDVKGAPGTTVHGAATLTLRWTGSDGRTYSTTSNAAPFTVRCTFQAGGGGFKL
jgi:hypothetical protein